MAGDPWAAAGYAPVTPSPTLRAQKSKVGLAIDQAALADVPLKRAAIGSNIAVDQAALAKAPIDRARASTALDVDQATKAARIRKEIADANDAEYTAKIKELQSRYPSMTGEQTLAGARAALMVEGDRAYNSAKHYDPGSPRNLLAGALEKIPLAGQTLSTFTRDPESQMAAAGQQQFTEGATRSLTGAGLRADERTFTSSDFYPLPGESQAVRNQKAALRKRYLNQIISAAGPAYQTDTATPSTVPRGPTVGQIVKGYRFKGGAPDRQENWEKVSP